MPKAHNSVGDREIRGSAYALEEGRWSAYAPGKEEWVGEKRTYVERGFDPPMG